MDAEKLTRVKELFDRLQHCCRPPPRISVPATDFGSIKAAADDVEVIYDWNSERYVWQLKENDIFGP